MKEKMRKIMKNEKGFTLIEMIVVMAIIGVLAAILIPSMSGFIGNSRNSQAIANGRTFYTAAAAAVTNLSAGTPLPDGTYTESGFTAKQKAGQENSDATKLKAEIEKLAGQQIGEGKTYTGYTLVLEDGAIKAKGSSVKLINNRTYYFENNSLEAPKTESTQS